MKLLLAICLLFTINGCKKEDLSPEVKMQFIVGEWDVSENIQTIHSDTLLFEENESFVLKMKADGTGKRSFLTTYKNFEWFYQFSPEKISLIFSSSAFSLDDFSFKIIKNSDSNQLWKFTKIIQSNDVNYTWTMTKRCTP